MPIHPAFIKHGIFTQYSVLEALARYSTYNSPNTHPNPKDPIDRFIFALQDMEISTVWIQLFTSWAKHNGDVEENDTGREKREELISRLQTANIQWAGWGYCASKNQARDLRSIEKYRNDLKMTAFVLNSEPHGKSDKWTVKDFETFTKSVSKLFGRDNLALSTWPVLVMQETADNPVIQMMKQAEPYICLFAPQAYFMTFPDDRHYRKGFDEKEFPEDDPVSYVRLVLESWKRLRFTIPLVVSGQAYWGEAGNPPQKTMEKKVEQFASGFADEDWSRIIGFNWYHAGKPKGTKEQTMSPNMINSIAANRLGHKPYKPA